MSLDKKDSQTKMDLEIPDIPVTEEQKKNYEFIFQEQEKLIKSDNQESSIVHQSTTENDQKKEKKEKKEKKDKDRMNSNSINESTKIIGFAPCNASTDNNKKSLEKISKQIEDSKEKKEDKRKRESSNLNININKNNDYLVNNNNIPVINNFNQNNPVMNNINNNFDDYHNNLGENNNNVINSNINNNNINNNNNIYVEYDFYHNYEPENYENFYDDFYYQGENCNNSEIFNLVESQVSDIRSNISQYNQVATDNMDIDEQSENIHIIPLSETNASTHNINNF